MCALQSVSTQRDNFVSTLARGSAEKYERLLDFLISWDVINWEEYEHVNILGQPLSKLVRELLDIITCKGEKDCKLFLDAFHKIEDGSLDEFNLNAPKDFSQFSLYLKSERPQIVRIIHKHIDNIFHHLLEHDYVTKYEVDTIQLPIFSPAQKARRLLDLLRIKGNDSAVCFLQFLQHLEQGAAQVPRAGVRYQKKLKSTISAQSQFLSTYDGTANICLEDVYTDSILELSKSTKMSDTIQGSQNLLGLLDIFSAEGLLNKNADTVLILGDAGSGKSTLLQQIHHLWAEGNEFQNFCFVFPFSCRRLCCVAKPVSLKALLFEYCCWPDELQEEIFQFILTNPNQVLFTFDGFDEFKFTFSDDNKYCSPTDSTSIASIVFNLLQGNLMKDSIKVLTSRPEAITAVLRKYVQKEVHLKGFSEEGIEVFMKKHHTKPDISTKIINMVKANSSLHGLCHIPVFCWLVSKCHEELMMSSCRPMQTITDMYVLALLHFLQHASPTEKLPENVLEKNINSISHLGKLALNGLCCGLYLFSHEQIVESQINEQDLSLGFLVPSKNLYTESTLSPEKYEFLHITFQCFFAALYIATDDDVVASSLNYLFNWSRNSSSNTATGKCFLFCAHPFLQNNNKECLKKIETQNLQIMASFVAGLFSERLYNMLVKSRQSQNLSRKLKIIEKCLSKGIRKHFKSIPPAVQGEIKSMHAMPEFIWLIKCINEMQNMHLSKKAVRGFDVDHLKLTYCRIGPTECSALAYVLKHIKKPIGLQLDHNSVGDIGIEQLIPCLHICKALYLRNNSITDKGICKLLDQALHWQNFQKIALFNNMLTDDCMDSFANLLKHKQNFLALRLGNNFITDKGAQALAEGLRENQSIQYLGLWGNQVGDYGAQAIANALQHNKSLIWLSLVSNDIGSVGAQALSAMLEKNIALEELCPNQSDLYYTEDILFDSNVQSKMTRSLFGLSNNHLGENGVSALAQALQNNEIVTAIWLKGTNLTPEEMQNLTKQDHRLLFSE
ncbi:nucleotide-binding oligomerization domain-containing 2 isoform X1 [Pelobates cultripes]|uniref:Nucleotide-binding oligomerization domain-containing 2 isoform X1 n=2 Tax=Pelobates cultripes TaxID=61616 RepID=A0AAD1TIG6_PELCU|nr:nucleotide-binding oligomerization domain-containing 2 isoform X1 [Pelobates cultripes]